LFFYGLLLISTWFFALNSATFNSAATLYLSPEVTPVKGNECKEFDTCQFQMSGYRAATEYTLFRAAGVLDFADDGKRTTAVNQRLFAQPFEPAMMRVWGIFKAIFSTALLFLVALGLRNRYRLK
jgi:hypothetical protein